MRCGRVVRSCAWMIAALLVVVPASGVANAQQFGFAQSPILTVVSERLFSDSDFGKRVEQEIQAASNTLATENRRIEAELTDEEKQLTEKRAQTTPDAFRIMADAFDTKVQNIRTAQDAKVRALAQQRDRARAEFFQAARPVLESLIVEAGAGVILERSSVFLSTDSADITDQAIARINAAIGNGLTPRDNPPVTPKQ